MAKHDWRSIDAHSNDGVESVLLSVFHIKEANTVIMDCNDQIAFELPDLQEQNLMTLCWCTLSEWGRESVPLSFADEASQYLIYEWPQPITTQNTYHGSPKIIDTALTLILP